MSKTINITDQRAMNEFIAAKLSTERTTFTANDDGTFTAKDAQGERRVLIQMDAIQLGEPDDYVEVPLAMHVIEDGNGFGYSMEETARPGRAWYIHVRDDDREFGTGYNGWWGDADNTLEEAVEEALIGSCLITEAQRKFGEAA